MSNVRKAALDRIKGEMSGMEELNLGDPQPELQAPMSDTRKDLLAKLRKRIGTSYGSSDAKIGSPSTSSEVGDPGMFVTFGGFIDKQGADVSL